MRISTTFKEQMSKLRMQHWQGQPVYKQYGKLKNFIRQHLDEETALIFSEPQVPKDATPQETGHWLTDVFDGGAAKPLNRLTAEERAAVLPQIERRISLLRDFAQRLEETGNGEDGLWSGLLRKCLIVPGDDYVLVSRDRFALVAWGFAYDRNGPEYNLAASFYKPGHRPDAKPAEPAETVPLSQTEEPAPVPGTSAVQSTMIEPAFVPILETTATNAPATPAENPKVPLTFQPVSVPAAPVKDPSPVSHLWLWLLLLLLIPAFLLYRGCSSPRQFLPDRPNVYVPVDSNKISLDSLGIRRVASDRVNVSLIGPNKNIPEFARLFKTAYPGNDYKIIFYDTITHRVQIQVPDSASRMKLKAEIKGKLPEFRLLVFDEVMMGGNRIPNDPALQNPQQSWHIRTVKAPEAWDVSEGSDGVIVAIIDDGFDLSHPEFQGRIVSPWNVPAQSSQVTWSPRTIHGTHVAGIALANAGNVGTAGIAHGCRFMPVQAGDRYGQMSQTAIVDGVIYAIEHGASVINMSLGMSVPPVVAYMSPEQQQRIIDYYMKDEEAFWEQVWDLAVERNVVVVLAGGNQNMMIGVDPMDRSNKVIKVSATDPNNFRPPFSNYGPYSSISAPGVEIYSSIPNASYEEMSGTSMAAPIVAGGVALIRSVNPSLGFRQILDLLQSTGMPLNTDRPIGNLLQLDRALAIARADRQQMPVVNCPDVQQKIDSLLQEIEKLRQSCQPGEESRDTLRIPPGATKPDFADGLWKSTYDLPTDYGTMVRIYFEFHSEGTGTVSFLDADGNRCEAPVSLRLANETLTIVQESAAPCQPPPRTIASYVFRCVPSQNGCATCEAQNRQKRDNNFTFQLVKINSSQ